MNVYIPNSTPVIILIGDIMLDHTIEGISTRIANEAPIPVIQSTVEKYTIGGCGNVLSNLFALGCAKVFLFSKIGDDTHGRILSSLLPSGVENHLTIAKRYTTITKHRIYSDKKLMCRYDNELCEYTTIQEEKKILYMITRIIEQNTVTSVVFSDYNKGFLTDSICQRIIALCNNHSITTVVDPKKDYNKYIGCTVIKPNRLETAHIFGIDLRAVPLEQGHRMIQDRVQCKTSVITLSEEGITAYSDNVLYQYCEDVKEIIDVTGAGDIVCSVLGVYYPFITDIQLLIKIASHLASISISHVGVYTITASDLLHTWRYIHSTKEISIELFRGISDPVVFTNGCFDLLHSAHIELFQYCRSLGGIVVVGINSDASIKRLKGPSRPVYSLKDRIKMLEAIEYIDFIIPFEDDTPFTLIKTIKPQWLVKGGDYIKKTIIGREYAKDVCIFNYINGKSTTNTIASLNNKM